MARISIKGILIGGIADTMSSFVLGIPFAIYAVAKFKPSYNTNGHPATPLTASIQGDIPLYLSQMLVGLICSALGGYIAARIAKHDELLNGALSSFLCVTIGISVMASGKDSHPLWVQFLILIAGPAFGLIGGYLTKLLRRDQSFRTS
jgi:putative membrane protein (TIGR04086 family)